jgi:hypothetical protein
LGIKLLIKGVVRMAIQVSSLARNPGLLSAAIASSLRRKRKKMLEKARLLCASSGRLTVRPIQALSSFHLLFTDNFPAMAAFARHRAGRDSRARSRMKPGILLFARGAVCDGAGQVPGCSRANAKL